MRKWQKANFGSEFGLFGQIWIQKVSSKIWFCQSLDIMASYHHVQYK